jgi:4-amino-4-deoxychorismate lyase
LATSASARMDEAAVDQAVAVLVRLDPGGPVVCGSRAPFLRADDLGVLRGDGVFERFVVDRGRPRHFDEHLQRLARSARLADIDLPAEEVWRAAAQAAVESWAGAEEWEMRLVCTRGPEEGGPPCAYVLGQELSAGVLRQREAGVSVVTVARGLTGGLTDEAPWLLLGVKTLSYAVNMAAKRWAEAQGADDAIFVGADGVVWEAASSAVIAARDGRLVSPPASLGILDSISVIRFFDAAEQAGWDVARDQVTVDDLFDADGVWLSSSLRFARVHTVDGKVLPAATAHDELAALAAGS